MKKEGKVAIWPVLIASILTFVVYVLFVRGEVPQNFPVNNTNASAFIGIGGTTFPSMLAFNGTNATFQCNFTSLNTTKNITRVLLFINNTDVNDGVLNNNTAIINQTHHINQSSVGLGIVFYFNLTLSAFNEGSYGWMCQMQDNSSGGLVINQSGTRYFKIDLTAPGFTNFTNTSISPTKVSTEDLIYISANFSDNLTTIHTVELLANVTGATNNIVNFTNGSYEASNNSIVNLSFRIPGDMVNVFINLTLRANDSVDNKKITSAIIIQVTGDGTVPGPILLNNSPINLFNQTSTTAPNFNFTAFDNNDTAFNCDINGTLGGSLFFNITNLNVTNGTIHVNTTTKPLSNGTYTWNVTCTDGAGNSNTSLSRTFTVDQIPPRVDYYNFTNMSAFNTSTPETSAYQLGLGDAFSRAQGSASTGKLTAIANWTDNLTDARRGALQFYNTSKESGQEWQTLNETVVNGSGGSFINGGWTNITFVIPSGHNNFEGANISFRVIGNDTLGNVNNSATVRNFTIQINDTTKPTITINGTIAVNGSNISAVSVSVVSWAVVDGSDLKEINVSVDGVVTDDGCDKFNRFTTTANAKRNNSFSTSTDPLCTLLNGSHFIEVKSRDRWGNVETVFHNFTVESGSVPTITLSSLENGLSVVNGSNVTTATGINFTVTNGGTAKMRVFNWTSSCNTSTQTIASSSTEFLVQNLTLIYPFQNISSCANIEANRTVTIKAADDSGNAQSAHFSFFVDDLAPSITVHSPIQGQISENNVTFNISVKDGSQKIGFIGYYLDGSDVRVALNSSVGMGNASFNLTNQSFNRNITGTHTIKFTASDALGFNLLNNTVNSSVITFTQTGPVVFNQVNSSVESYIANVFNNNLTNVSIRVKTDDLGYVNILTTNETSTNTFEMLFDVGGAINISLTDFNGSKANWDKMNFTPYINKSDEEAFVQTNWTNTVLNSTWFNNSIAEFLPDNNTYYGTVVFRLNDSGRTPAGPEFWWIENEGTVTTKVNISQCTSAFTRTSTTPCWNYTSGGRTIVQVPHFSVVAAVNDSSAPTINVTTPLSNQTVSMFEPNITVSLDTAVCKYQTNSSSPTNRTMILSGTKCTGGETERLKNLNAAIGYNITFWVTDNNGNTNQYLWRFNISDTTSPNNGEITSSASTTTATVTITGTNESVNATVNYGTSNTSLGSSASETDFNVTQTVSLTGLTASTTYHYNVTVCDFNGNCKTNSTVFSFATSAAAAAAASTSSGGGGGGGGGAAAPITEAASTSKKWDSLPAGSSAVLTINNANIAVTGVVVDVKNAVTNAEVKVASLNSNPISTAAAAKVYQYLQLTKSNVADTDTSKITINFKVPKSWLTTNGVGEDNVLLYRYSDSKWNSLSTTKTGSDANNVLYSAVTPGFSTFAIGSKEAAPAVAPPTEEKPAEVPVPTGEVPTKVEEKPAVSTAMEKKPMSRTTIALIVVAVIIVIAAVGYFMMQKKKE